MKRSLLWFDKVKNSWVPLGNVHTKIVQMVFYLSFILWKKINVKKIVCAWAEIRTYANTCISLTPPRPYIGSFCSYTEHRTPWGFAIGWWLGCCIRSRNCGYQHSLQAGWVSCHMSLFYSLLPAAAYKGNWRWPMAAIGYINAPITRFNISSVEGPQNLLGVWCHPKTLWDSPLGTAYYPRLY